MTVKELNICASLAWRNVWSNTRRTILTMLTILVGAAMIVFMNAYSNGAIGQMIEDSVTQNTGHLQIHEKGYWDGQTIDYAFIPDRSLISTLNMLKSDGRISGYSRRIVADVLLYHKDSNSGVRIQGVFPDEERSVSSIQSSVIRGHSFSGTDDAEILLGVTCAENMSVDIGDTVSLLSQGFDGSIAADKLKVVGIFRSSNPEYDQGLALIPFTRAADIFSMNEFIHSIVIRSENSENVPDLKKTLLGSAGASMTEILDWGELQPVIRQILTMGTFKPLIFDLILIMVVAFGILNTIQMSIYERTREFGIMLAVGTRPEQIVAMVILESFFISLLGLIAGVSLGGGLGYYFQIHPIDMTSYSNEFSTWGMNSLILPAKVGWQNIVFTSLSMLCVTLIFSISPARRASMLKPVDAIRQL